MDSYKEFRQLIDKLDVLQKRLSNHLNRKIKDDEIKRSTLDQVNRLIDEVKQLLEHSRSAYVKDRQKIADPMYQEPGVKLPAGSQKDFRKLIDQIDIFKEQSLSSINKNIKDESLKQSTHIRLEEIFNEIKQILELCKTPFDKAVQRFSDRMREEPGVKVQSKGLISIEGIGERFAQTLKNHGIRTTVDLLGIGATRTGRTSIEKTTGISNKLVLDWVNRVDLLRIRGVGVDYADLLEASGVDTVPELAQRNPQNLYQKLAEVNAEKKLVRQLPGEAQVRDWVEQAKQLPRVIEY
jgi:predicted flap endonuclease-1-like 5' DNA nuclease